MISNMSLPLHLLPASDESTAILVPGRTVSLPEIERIQEWQAGMSPSSLAEKPLPNEKPLPPLPTPATKKSSSWKKLVTALSPLSRKRRTSRKSKGPGAFSRLEDTSDANAAQLKMRVAK